MRSPRRILPVPASSGVRRLRRRPETSPSARSLSAMVYDSFRERTVLFSGNNGAADTWEWDGTNWSLRSPSTSPSARAYHAMAYDALRHRTVLFGGDVGAGQT